MITTIAQKDLEIKLQEETCPDCGSELVDGVCPVCNPEEDEETEEGDSDFDLDEEENIE